MTPKNPKTSCYKKKSKNEKGILSLDFIFSFMAVYAISMVFTLLSVTLMMSDVVQYISYSMARAHISGDVNIDEQKIASEEKLNELLGTYLGVLIKREGDEEAFFTIEPNADPDLVLEDTGWSGGGARQRPYGMRIRYISNVLRDARIPILGSPSDGGDEDFGTANIYSFLYREPSTEECLNFNRARWNVIQQRFSNLRDMPNVPNGEFGADADNGC